MTTRQKNNSMSAGLFSESSQSSGTKPLAAIPIATPQTQVSSSSALNGSIGLAFLATVVNAVKLALAADGNFDSSSGTSAIASLQEAETGCDFANITSTIFGGIPAQPLNLSDLMVNSLASGVGFQAIQPPPSSSAPQGRQLFSVPSFVSTFVAPPPAISSISIMVSSPLSMPSSDSTPISSLPSGPLLPPETQNWQTCLRLLWLRSWVR